MAFGWRTLAGLLALCSASAASAQLRPPQLVFDSIKVVSSETNDRLVTFNYEIVANSLRYELSTVTTTIGLRTGKGSFSIAPPPDRVLDSPVSYFFFSPAPFTVTETHDSVVTVRASVERRFARPCDIILTGVTVCPIVDLDIETTPKGILAYLDVSFGVSIVSGAGMRLRYYFRMELAPECVALNFGRIEVVQVVQDVNNSIPLIVGKPAVARLFLRMVNPPKLTVTGVTAVLNGFRGGVKLADSPLRPFNGPLSVASEVRRGEIDHSLNFELPRGWLTEGQLELQADIRVPPCAGLTDPLLLDGKTNVQVEPGMNTGGVPILRIGWIAFCYQPPGTEKRCADEDLIPGYDYLIRKMYPIAPQGVEFVPVYVPELAPHAQAISGVSDLYEFLNSFKRRYLAAEARIFDYLLAVFPKNPNSGAVGLGPRSSGVAYIEQAAGAVDKNGKAVPLEDPFNETHYNADTVAHELGHVMGRTHTGNKVCTMTGKESGDGAGFWGGDWPYATADVQEVGFDVESRKVTQANYGDLMSYCANLRIQEWVSPHTYTELLKKGRQGRAREASEDTKTRAAAAIPQAILSGWAGREGSAAGLDPIYQVLSSDESPESKAGGSHCLRFFGSAGRISDHCFDLAFADPAFGMPLEKDFFAVKLPLPAGTTRIALMTGTRELATLSAAATPPALTIVSPRAGDRWDGGTRTISWSGSSPDGTPLLFAVLYSSDGGQSWLPMAMDIRGTQLTFDPARIQGGRNVLFRVMATAGLSSSTADVGPLEVAQTPAIEARPTPLNFRNQAVGQSAIQTLNIGNTGNGPLAVTSVSIDNPAFRVISPQTPLTMRAGVRPAISVQWRVDAAGPQNAVLRIASSDPNRPRVEIPIQGIAFRDPVPNIDAPASLDFGSLSPGQSKELTLTVGNSGGGPLTLRSITSTNARFTATSPALPATVAAGESAIIAVRFSPTAAGAATSSLAIVSNDPTLGSVTVAASGSVTGAAAGPAIAISSTALDFGSVNSGQTKDLTFTVSNSGITALAVSPITSNNPLFSVTSPTAGFQLGPGVLQTVTVRFSSVAAGLFSGALTISSNDPARPSVSVPLSATGAAGGPSISVTPASLDFGSVNTGQTKDLTLSVVNRGSAPLTVSSLGAPAAPFTILTPPPAQSGPAGQSFTVTVRFAPTAAGAFRTAMTIASNDLFNPTVSVALTGTGVATALVAGGNGPVLYSDTFNRPNADRCTLGAADNALGGSGSHYYIPLYSRTPGGANPIGAAINSGSLFNTGIDFTGVEISAKDGACTDTTVVGENFPADMNIRADVFTPSTAGYISQTGPFFGAQAVSRGGDLNAGAGGGFWVQVHSTGEVKIVTLQTMQPFAVTGRPASYDSAIFHTVEAAVSKGTLQVALDGKLLTFRQEGRSVTVVQLVQSFTAQGASAGILMGAGDNPGQIGGQRAKNLAVAGYGSLTALPLAP